MVTEIVADMEVHMVADMEVDKVANMVGMQKREETRPKNWSQVLR